MQSSTQSNIPDAPFQIGDRVESRRKRGGKLFGMERFPGIVVGVSKIGTSRRSVFQFDIRFDDKYQETIPLTTKHTGVVNIIASTRPLHPPTPPSPKSPPPTLPSSQTQSTQPLPPPPLWEPPSLLRGTVTEPTAPPTPPAPPTQTCIPVRLEQTLWLDEKHKKIVLGLANTFEWLLCVDPEDPGKLKPLSEGGVRQPEQPVTQAKYTDEARALFGVMMTHSREGRRMPLFNYTGKKVLICFVFSLSRYIHNISLIVCRWLVLPRIKKLCMPKLIA